MATRYKLIYNPRAGLKRHLISVAPPVTVDSLKDLTRQYQLDVDFFPTKGPKHATELARQAASEGYDAVIVAGGDGTVGEAANGLVNSSIPLGIIPLGTFMNICKMLSIPTDIEKALLLIKVGRTRQIDMGRVTCINGTALDEPYYFIESAGIGLDAQLQRSVWAWEREEYRLAWQCIKTLLTLYRRPVTIYIEDRKITTRASLITIANGPLTGAGMELTPESKLDDHRLLVSVFSMTNLEFVRHFWSIFRHMRHRSPGIHSFSARTVRVEGNDPRAVHADGRLFGKLPAEFSIQSNALHVIAGFSAEPSKSALTEPEYIEP